MLNTGRSTKRKQVRGVDGVEDADASASQDVPAVGVRDESPETWGALLAGLAELCAGIGEALCQEICACVCMCARARAHVLVRALLPTHHTPPSWPQLTNSRYTADQSSMRPCCCWCR
jgi:hypothetical protein